MVLLTFTGQKKDLLSLRKTQTIRYNLELWQGREERAKPKKVELHIWWQNPRTRKAECYRMGFADLLDLTPREGSMFTEMDAKLDGFLGVWELVNTLKFTNKLRLMQDVLDHEWAILTWRWHDGYPKKPPAVPLSRLGHY